MVQKSPEDREFDPRLTRLNHTTTGNLSVKPVVNRYLFESEKDKAGNRER